MEISEGTGKKLVELGAIAIENISKEQFLLFQGQLFRVCRIDVIYLNGENTGEQGNSIQSVWQS